MCQNLNLINLLTREPDKPSALLHAILEIGSRYDLQEEDFLRAALRSYQEIHENYFQDLEDAALAFSSEFGKEHGINVIVENHGGLSSNGKWLSRVLKDVGLPNCG